VTALALLVMLLASPVIASIRVENAAGRSIGLAGPVDVVIPPGQVLDDLPAGEYELYGLPRVSAGSMFFEASDGEIWRVTGWTWDDTLYYLDVMKIGDVQSKIAFWHYVAGLLAAPVFVFWAWRWTRALFRVSVELPG
jgi:hypothetical protein